MNRDEILLKIKRNWSKDESIGLLMKELEAVRFTNGELMSEIAELKDEITKLNTPVSNEGKKTKRQWLQEDVFKELNKELNALRPKIGLLNKEITLWRNRYFSLLASTTKEK